MSQLTLYIPDALAKTIQARAKRAKLSLSAYVASVLQREVAPQKWPAAFVALSGSMALQTPEDLPPSERDPVE